MEVGAGRLDDDRDGDVWLTFILSTTKDLAKPGNGSLWAQILRPGLRMTIPTQEFLSSPPLVSREPSCLLLPSSFFLLPFYFFRGPACRVTAADGLTRPTPRLTPSSAIPAGRQVLPVGLRPRMA